MPSSTAWSRKIDAMAKNLGVSCTATLNGTPTNFYGIFKTQNLIKDDESGAAVLVDEDTLWVNTITIGNLLKDGTTILVNGAAYKCSQMKQVDDGMWTAVVLQEIGANG